MRRKGFDETVDKIPEITGDLPEIPVTESKSLALVITNSPLGLVEKELILATFISVAIRDGVWSALEFVDYSELFIQNCRAFSGSMRVINPQSVGTAMGELIAARLLKLVHCNEDGNDYFVPSVEFLQMVSESTIVP